MAREYIESLKFDVTIRPDLNSAEHRYEYVLRNVGDEPHEDNFTFDVPNATLNEIGDVVAHDGYAGRHPTIDKQPFNSSTRLIFSNLLPIGAGQSRILNFSYTAPTSTFKHSGILSNVGFYRAQLFHSHPVNVATITIRLPKHSKIIKYVGNAMINDASIQFQEHDLTVNTLYTYPIFFTRRKPITTLGLAGATVGAGAILDESAARLLQIIISAMGG